MTESGDAAEQVVRMMLSGSEVAIRLTGSGLKNAAALILALAKDNKKVLGKVRLAKMLRITRDIRGYRMTPEEYNRFERIAKKKILYSAYTDKNVKDAPIELLIPSTEIERANMIFEDIKFVPRQEKQPERSSQEQKEPKNASRSGPGSRDTRDRSSTRSGSERTMNERSSVEQKLKDNKAALEQKRQQQIPARTRNKYKKKGRSK